MYSEKKLILKQTPLIQKDSDDELIADTYTTRNFLTTCEMLQPLRRIQTGVKGVKTWDLRDSTPYSGH